VVETAPCPGGHVWGKHNRPAKSEADNDRINDALAVDQTATCSAAFSRVTKRDMANRKRTIDVSGPRQKRRS